MMSRDVEKLRIVLNRSEWNDDAIFSGKKLNLVKFYLNSKVTTISVDIIRFF